MNIIEKTYTLNGTLQKRTKTDMIILHHRAGNGDVEGIDKIHKNQGWTCIGYHFYVRKDGSIYRGRKEDTVGAHAYGSNYTSIGICAEGNFETDIMSEAQKNSIKELVAYLKNKYNISTVKRHKDVNATACPGKNYPFDEIVDNSEDNKNEASSSNKKSNETIANEVIAGKWGNGDARKTALQNAGYDYSAIQSIVNKKLTGKASNTTTNKKSISTLVDEVIAGKWGNGNERKEKLEKAGYNYSEVQAAVNKKLSGKSTSNKKSNETIANEVIKGLWGNGADRKNKLTAAGYDYDTIQAIVNKKLL